MLEAGERVTYDEIMRVVNSLKDGERADEDVALERLDLCRECDNLISGMCLKCGCYVEIRARLRDSDCPDFDNKKW